MKISELAKQANVKVDTIRYYEKRQLLAVPERTDAGYRIYASSDLKRLLFIVQAKTLGFTLEEIRELLALQIGTTDCERVRKIAQRKSQEITLRMQSLSRIQQTLDTLAQQCSDRGKDACPILKSLTDPHEEP